MLIEKVIDPQTVETIETSQSPRLASQTTKAKSNTEGLSEEAVLVRDALIARGMETPMIPNQQSEEQKYLRIKSLMTEMMSTLGLDLSDDSLMETPHRIAKMYVHEIFSGLNYKEFPRVSMVRNKMRVDEMVKVSDIKLTSTCEHHFVVIDGAARVAYIPNEHVIGLSKINRIVKFFASRPQIQERLTQQVLIALQTLLKTENVAVSIKAKHYCVIARGVEDAQSSTETNALGGVFKTVDATRSEFFS